jgi:hypothetical protein
VTLAGRASSPERCAAPTRGAIRLPLIRIMLRPRHSVHATLRFGALVAALAMTSRSVLAQGSEVALPNPRHVFEDSWYWGAKGGVMRFGTVVDGRVSAPLAGGEWLITHRQGALLVSAEQSFFDRSSRVADQSMSSGMRTVSIHDARRYSAAALAAPVQYGAVRPYAGIGLALHVIRRATPDSASDSQQQLASMQETLSDAQSFVSPFVTLGAQAQFGAAALFVQGSMSAAHARSLFNGGSSQLEAGIRVNVASAFER